MDNADNSLSGKRILVTGGSGNLAHNLIEQLRYVDCHIIRLHRLGTNPPVINGKAHIEDIVGDIRNLEVWESVLTDIDVVFHFAAQTSIYLADQDPHTDMSVNVIPMLHLLEICRKKDITPIVLFSGTATEVGLPVDLPVDESHQDNPVTIYDIHKLMAENYLKLYTSRGVVKGVVLRLANVYGPGPESSSADRGVLNLMIRKALAGEPLTVYGDGNYARDYVYVDDVTRAFLSALVNIEHVVGKHYLIGSQQKYTIADAFNLVAERVALRTGKRSKVINIPPPPSLSLIESRNFVANTKNFKTATGWDAKYSLVDGIDRTIENYISISAKG